MGKLQFLRSWVEENEMNMSIVIDGGVNRITASSVKIAGANVLVSGSFLFRNNNLVEGSKILLND